MSIHLTQPHSPRRLRLARLSLLLAASLAAAVTLRAAAADFPEAPKLPGKIVYQRATDSDQWDLYISDANGENEMQLTNTKDASIVGEEATRWSPDGQEVAFSNYDDKNGTMASIYRVPAAGGTPAKIIAGDGRGHGMPAWRPDGQAIAYAGSHAGGGDSTADLKLWTPTGTRVIVASNQLDEQESDWSPDGRQLVYEAEPAGGRAVDSWWGIHMVNADGTDDHALIDKNNVSERHPRLSPDGMRLAYVTYNSPYGAGRGTLRIREMETGEDSPYVLGAAGPAAWSPDGDWLVFYGTVAEGPGPANLVAADSDRRRGPVQVVQRLGLYVINLNTGDMYRLHGSAGGAMANENTFQWGYGPHWRWAGLIPTPVTPTVEPTITPTPQPSATPTTKAEVTPTSLPTTEPKASQTPTPSSGLIYLPKIDREFELPAAPPTGMPTSLPTGIPTQNRR